MQFYTNVQVSAGKIFYRGVKDGHRIMKKISYNPTLFVPSKDKTEYHGILGETLDKINPGTIRETRDFVDKYSGFDSFPIYGQRRYEYCYISDEFKGPIKWSDDQIITANLDIEVGSEDGFPEPDIAKEEITAITVKRAGRFHVFGIGEFTHDRKDLTYYRCKDESDLLQKFLDCWSEMYPDIITGWNVKYFDITYLVNRIVKILGEIAVKRLSPWGVIRLKTDEYMNIERSTYTILGIAVWDYLQLFRKYSKGGWSHESYKLDAIAFDVLGKRKIDYAEYGTLRRLYKENHQLFIEYNISDVELVDQIDEKEKIINLCLNMAYTAKVNFEDVFSQVRMWDVIIFNKLRDQKIVIPPLKTNVKNEKYIGAAVKDVLVGMHDHVASFDLKGLYPSLMMQFNISPETLISPHQYTPEMHKILNEYDIGVEDFLGGVNPEITKLLKAANVTLTPNGHFFHVDKIGFLPEILEEMTEDRDQSKRLMLEAEQNAEKAGNQDSKKQFLYEQSKHENKQRTAKEGLNSAYGAMGNQFFRYFAIPLAEGVTTSGQLVIKSIIISVNRYLNIILKTNNKDYIIASDTDSIYINMNGIVKMAYGDSLSTTPVKEIIEFMNVVCRDKIHPVIVKTCEKIGQDLNVFKQKMSMKREILANRGMWRAKKHYMLNVYANESVQYEEPKLKISGMAAVKSSSPSICRKKIKEAFKIIMNGTNEELIEFVENFRDEFETMPLPDIAFPRSVNGVEDYEGTETNAVYAKGSPQHVKATLYYNKMISDRKLEGKYELIKEGEKIKFIELKQPNPFGTPIIAFMTVPPAEFELEKWVDYELQFEKSFKTPLKLVLDCIGWKIEKTNSLMGFMGR